MAGNRVHLYFHSPCFDGTVSAALLADYLSTADHADVELHPVNYHLNDQWPALALEQPAAVVDFLYHPGASIWFDHHSTTFINQQFEEDWRGRRDPLIVYDRRMSSCAMLIWQAGLRFTGDHHEKVVAADLIDAARYESPQQAVYGDAPAFRISASFAVGETEEYSKFLVRQLVSSSLETTANLPEVAARYERFRELRDRGMRGFAPSANLSGADGYVLTDDGILLFAVDGSDGIVSRYAPFTVAPGARYSLGVVTGGDVAKITAMRNPWLEFPSVPLGEIFRRFGGGGHQRVASTRLHGKTRTEAVDTVMEIRAAIQSAVENPMATA